MDDNMKAKNFMCLPIFPEIKCGTISHLCRNSLDILLRFPVSSWAQKLQVEETEMISTFPVSTTIVES